MRQGKASLNFKYALPLATALVLPAAMPAVAETIDIAIGHQRDPAFWN
jgi:hypothetical protein